MLENIIGVDEAAEILGLSPGTVKNYCAQGKIKAKKIGKTWVMDKTKLEEENKMKVTIEYRKNHEGIVGKEWEEVYGEYEERLAKEEIVRITEEYEAAINADGFELDDQDKMNDIEAATNLHEGEYDFNVGDFTYYITVKNEEEN